MNKYPDILRVSYEPGADDFLRSLEGKKPLFLCTIGTTDTAKIPGISAAGKNPEYVDYTPAADVELLHYGRCRCISNIPVTPEGIPTPALITKAAVDISGMPMLVADAGSRVKPQIPLIDLGGKPGGDIRGGKAVKDAAAIFEFSKMLGRSLAEISDYLVLGESIPGGTTTALSVMMAMGLDAEGKVSSSMPENPHSLKLSVARIALEAAGVRKGDLERSPIDAIRMVGDPVQAALAGLIVGAAGHVRVLMAGGTQMSAVLAVVDYIAPSHIRYLAIGTTSWLVRDESSDLVGLIKQVDEVPILAVDMSFSKSRHRGLQAYELGAVKEGVGSGGASIAAILMSLGQVTCQKIQERTELEYQELVSKGIC
ncbi:MAG: nicotinate mononucleotide-dependent phosphoribosyltransferase CobT [Candidatus Bathyarchaeia archaeon]